MVDLGPSLPPPLEVSLSLMVSMELVDLLLVDGESSVIVNKVRTYDTCGLIGSLLEENLLTEEHSHFSGKLFEAVLASNLTSPMA